MRWFVISVAVWLAACAREPIYTYKKAVIPSLGIAMLCPHADGKNLVRPFGGIPGNRYFCRWEAFHRPILGDAVFKYHLDIYRARQTTPIHLTTEYLGGRVKIPYSTELQETIYDGFKLCLTKRIDMDDEYILVLAQTILRDRRGRKPRWRVLELDRDLLSRIIESIEILELGSRQASPATHESRE